MNLSSTATTTLLIAALLGGSFAAPPADAWQPAPSTPPIDASQYINAYNDLVSEINSHVNRLCAAYPPTATCNRVTLESSALLSEVRYIPIDQAVYKLANYAGKLRATK